ncbi:MAG TPA: transposase [Pyrinomonadaceae bacterium]|nr:transposase [Pyrinomonadaceae bacterium]
MFRISKDSPAYYLTSVSKDRLQVFRKAELRDIACEAIGEARRSAQLLLFAYVVMYDHLHLIAGSDLKPSKVGQYVNGITGRRVIDYLKVNGHELSLEKLKHANQGRNYRHSLWDHHPNIKLLTTEDMLMQKVNYVHQNPVRRGLVSRAEDYKWSSARCWSRNPLEDEPLIMDLDKILWRAK